VAGAFAANGYANGGHIESLGNGGVVGGDENGRSTSATDGVVVDRKNPLKHRSGTEALPMFTQDVGPPPKTYSASLASLAGSGSKTASLSLRAASIVLMIAVGLESFGCSGRWVGIKSTSQMDQGPSVPHSVSSSFSLLLCLSFMASTIPRAAILGVCSRSAFGRSFKSWMALVLSVVVTTASGMAVEDSWASRRSMRDLDSGAVTISMPLNIGATATTTALATGAIGVAALLHVWAAIRNASQARYVRFGMVVGVLWVVGILFMAGLGCYGGGMIAVCSLFD
jgi:hypothetical protein